MKKNVKNEKIKKMIEKHYVFWDKGVREVT